MPLKIKHGVRSSNRTKKRLEYGEGDVDEEIYPESSGQDFRVNMPMNFDFSKKEKWSSWIARWERYR